ncbi:MAG: acyl-CoA synthetase [Chloroflexi bacterium]|nr:acyl-CoA synthetase [Chloroflexota bacterium]
MKYPVQVQAELLPPGALPEMIFTLPEMLEFDEINITEHFLDRNLDEERANKIAFYSGDRQITYKALHEQVNRFANGLRSVGVEKGDRVVLRISNRIEFVVSALAIHRIGAVAVPTMILLREKVLTYIANVAEVKAIISEHDLLDEIEAGRDKFETVKCLIAVGGDRAELKSRGYQQYEDLIEISNDQIESVKVAGDDVACVFFSSGTTGMPKGCMHTHRTIVNSEYAPPYIFNGIRPTDVISGTPPLAFVFGYGHMMLVPMLCGVAAVLIEGRLSPEVMFETIDKFRVTLFNSAPAAYNQMLQVPDAEKKYDLGCLRVALSGSAPLMPATIQQWKTRFGITLANTIGSSETYQSYLSTWKPESKPGSLGHPVPGWVARVIDEKGDDCEPGVIGRLAIRGPGGIMYWRNPEKQRDAVENGWSLTGDLAYKDADGCFFHVSRSDDIIKSRGYRVSPGEVEDALLEHPAVFEPAIVGSPDEIQGEKVKAFIILKAGQKGSPELAEELRRFVRAKVPAYMTPSEFEFVDSLPKTETGKVRRIELKQMEMRRYAERQSGGERKE